MRWLIDKRRLSRDQLGTLERCVHHGEPVGVSGMSLLEMSLLSEAGRLRAPLGRIFADMQDSPAFQILPITFEIAEEVQYLALLRDPGDRVIVATARVHRLTLITSDERIIASKLVSVVE
jgi:PIN domain nuclease of toxin-antitoxin system